MADQISAGRICVVCGAIDEVRSIAIVIEGEELRMKPDFCSEHCDELLLRYGQLLAEIILREHCLECMAVGEPDDNRHKPWCSKVIDRDRERGKS